MGTSATNMNYVHKVKHIKALTSIDGSNIYCASITRFILMGFFLEA
jgi:hypothetical protein